MRIVAFITEPAIIDCILAHDRRAGATGPTAGSETVEALEFLARVVSHIPDKGQVLQRYHGGCAVGPVTPLCPPDAAGPTAHTREEAKQEILSLRASALADRPCGAVHSAP